MADIVIKIKQYNQDWSDAGTLDVGDDTEINTIFQLSDVREPESRSTNYIKTFSIPGTKRNNRLFQAIFEGGFHSFYFDPTKKIEAQVLVNNNQYFTGNLQVNKINKIDNKYISSYEITIYGKVASFFTEINDLELKEMVNLSEFNHEYSVKNVIASWGKETPNQFPFITSPKPAGFIYQNGSKVPFQLGNGYVYPQIWRGQTDQTTWKTEDFKPAIYLKTYFDRILNSAKVKYKSDFINSEYFRKLIIPGDSQIESVNGVSAIELTDDQVKKYQFEVGILSPNNIITLVDSDTTSGKSWSADIVLLDDTTLPNNDVSNQYNTTTGIFTVGKTGQYTWATELNLVLTFKPKLADFNEMRIIGAKSWGAEVWIQEVGTPNIIASKSFNWSFNDVFDTWKDWSYWIFNYQNSEKINLVYNGPLIAGKKYQIKYKHTIPGGNYTYKTDSDKPFTTLFPSNTNCPVNIRLASGTIVNELAVCKNKSILAYTNKAVIDGDTMDLNWFIPDMKVGDLIKEINRMFNLYWLPLDDSTFLIEPRDDFYKTKNNIKDWTGKVDNLDEVSIQPLYDLNFKKYTWTYSADDDFYNSDYEKNHKEIYSKKVIEIDADFINEETTYESKFAASPLVAISGTDKYMTTFVNQDNSKWVYQKPKIRLLFYGGLKTTNSLWYLINPYKGLKTTIHNEYPYAGHLDDPTSPSNDLSWGLPKSYYFTYQKITTNTLFNKFWRANIEEITNINSHLLTVQAVISDQDIVNFDIRDIIQIDNIYYRVNKLTHNPTTGIAEIELFKALDTNPYQFWNKDTGTGPVIPIIPDQPIIPSFFNSPISPTTWGTAPAPKIVLFSDRWGGGLSPWTPTPNGDWNAQTDFATVINNSTFAYPNPIGNETMFINPLRGESRSWGEIQPSNTWTEVSNRDMNSNYYSIQGENSVLGSSNIIHPTAQLVKVSGNANYVHADARNVNIQGDGNIVLAGLSNVSVIGDNQIVTESNWTYINGLIISNGTSKPKVKILKSPSGVGNEFKNGYTTNIIYGGKNSTAATRKVVGGQDTVGNY